MTFRWKKHLLGLTVFAVFVLAGVLFLWFYYGSGPSAVLKRGWAELHQLLNRQPEADVLLPVIFDRQDHSLSCEAADLKMVLAYRNVTVTEGEILAAIGVDPTPKQDIGGQVIWGDPQNAFVGNVDGRMLQDGYGVYWDPIAKVAQKYRQAKVITNGTAAQLAEYISQGDPVIAWSYLGSGQRYQWQTPQGKTIEGIYSEHPVVVRGFKGDESDPQGFFVIDPIYGYKYLTTDYFMSHWAAFDHSGVVVY